MSIPTIAVQPQGATMKRVLAVLFATVLALSMAQALARSTPLQAPQTVTLARADGAEQVHRLTNQHLILRLVGPQTRAGGMGQRHNETRVTSRLLTHHS